MFINVEETPNPNTLKFIPEKDISVDRSYIFKKTDDLRNNDFLKDLFDIDGVESILIDSGFISVTKDNSSSWDVLRTILTSKISDSNVIICIYIFCYTSITTSSYLC